jgi:hypothetical protein
MVEDLGCLVGKWRNNGYRDGELGARWRILLVEVRPYRWMGAGAIILKCGK